MAALLDMSAARVFFDGIFTEPRVAHPEGVAIHADGSIWCGTEVGDLLRIAADGSGVERMGSTGGFALGIAFDAAGNCFICDLKHAAIFRYDALRKKVEPFAASGIRVPNYPVADEARGVLYVTDSRGNNNVGPGIFRYSLKTGEGGVWSTAPMDFANGMAMGLDGQGLYVIESDAAQLSYVPIEVDGSAGTPRLVVADLHNVPDGVAVAADGTLCIACYEPSRIYRLKPGGALELLIEDPHATTIAHPTNVALKGDKLYTSNLGRWHITEIDLSRL
ncbi:MAG: SMP-30/Gluconolaconase/LRE domain protein [Hyphomicrobiales bacterium]|nr:SMP-30/Gluconolaconase/LRE domain protein [Hyphomicrobiales bacterium]